MNLFKRKIVDKFTKKKYIYPDKVCFICKSDRGLVCKTRLCYKCVYNHVSLTKFKF